MAQNAAATVSTANQIAKKVHGTVVDKILPSSSLKGLNRVKYDKSAEVGGSFAEMVWLTYEHGFTPGGTGGSKVTLGGAEVATSKETSFTPYSMHFQTEITIELLSRAASKGDKAFERYITRAMLNSKKAANKRKETLLWHGGLSLGTVSSATDGNTSTVVTFTEASWAPHVWVGMKNCPFDVYSGSTRKTTDAALYATKIDIKNRQVTFTGDADDIDRLVAVGTNGSGAEFYFYGHYDKVAKGLRYVSRIDSSSSTNYLGIDAGVYLDKWNATQVDVGSEEFTWLKANEGLEEAAGRGTNCRLLMFVPFPVWGSLNANIEALRVFDQSYSVKRTELGREVESITYHGITGPVEVIPSGFLQNGEVVCIPDPADDDVDVRLIGSSDFTFNVPSRGDEMFRLVENANTVELRAFWDSGLYTTNVSDFISFTGIVTP